MLVVMLSLLLLLVADIASAISGSAPALTVISTQQFWSPPVDWFRLGSVCVSCLFQEEEEGSDSADRNSETEEGDANYWSQV